MELQIFASDGVRAYSIPEGDELVVGRDERCGARVDDPSVSRRHAELSRRGDVVRVRDLGSANGTFLRDATPATAGATLHLRPARDGIDAKVGSVLHFGSVLALIRRAAEARSFTSVVRAPAMRAIYERAEKAAGARISVLLLGETGVGKEVLARTIHERSPRASGPFVALNCAALAPTLIESELFGHEKGAFTGADRAQVGLLESGHGGTVFLDEIGDLPTSAQGKLLRVLEERVVLKVGGRVPKPIDVRVVSATHRDLESACRAGTFREDLFFRLNGMSLTIPPLRERASEIMDLARMFVARGCDSAGRASAPALSPEATAALEGYAWPGNVRELRNAMELAVVLCESDEIGLDHLPEKIGAFQVKPVATDEAGEKAQILDALERTAGNQTKAAKLLGMSRRSLVTRLTAYGMTRVRKPG